MNCNFHRHHHSGNYVYIDIRNSYKKQRKSIKAKGYEKQISSCITLCTYTSATEQTVRGLCTASPCPLRLICKASSWSSSTSIQSNSRTSTFSESDGQNSEIEEEMKNTRLVFPFSIFIFGLMVWLMVWVGRSGPCDVIYSSFRRYYTYSFPRKELHVIHIVWFAWLWFAVVESNVVLDNGTNIRGNKGRQVYSMSVCSTDVSDNGAQIRRTKQ